MLTSSTIRIGNRIIGQGHPPYIVAEMSGNHNGQIERAFRIIDAAKQAGVDALKIQTYRADTITINHTAEEFSVQGGLWAGRNLYDLYKEAHTPWEWHEQLFYYAKSVGITLFSSPFDHSAVDFLETFDAPAYKIASPELIDLPLIRRVSRTGKPVIMSTGASTLDEISEAVVAAREAGATDLILLHCTAAYPAPPNEANLASIAALANRFNVISGLSDHTMGTLISSIAIALGASFIEKHFTLSRADGGVDSAFSLEPQEMAELVSNARLAQEAIGSERFGPTKSEESVLQNRRSLYVVRPVACGEEFTKDNIRSIRPAKGLKPKFFDSVLGRRASRDISYGEPLHESMISGWSESSADK
jgi:pseudaminic acid synthase